MMWSRAGFRKLWLVGLVLVLALFAVHAYRSTHRVAGGWIVPNSAMGDSVWRMVNNGGKVVYIGPAGARTGSPYHRRLYFNITGPGKNANAVVYLPGIKRYHVYGKAEVLYPDGSKEIVTDSDCKSPGPG